MPPPVESWPAAELPIRVFSNTKGDFRKGFKGNLKACEKLGMLQYRCEVDDPGSRNSTVRCWPVERFFRRYVVSSRIVYIMQCGGMADGILGVEIRRGLLRLRQRSGKIVRRRHDIIGNEVLDRLERD